MMNRIRFLAGACAGAAAQYLLDPRSGPARRAALGERLAFQAREVAKTIDRGFVKGLLAPLTDRVTTITRPRFTA